MDQPGSHRHETGSDAARSAADEPSERPAHPWPASIALVVGVVVLIVALSLVSMFR